MGEHLLSLRATPVALCFVVALCHAQAPPKSPYVGTFVCKGCHTDLWNAFSGNAHFRSFALKNKPPEETGCEGCHGPGRAHVRSAGNKTLIRTFTTLTPEAQSKVCMNCHARDLHMANQQASPHATAGVACTNCHSVHHAKTPLHLLSAAQKDLCYGCHADVRAQFSMPFKHRVNEGAIECSDCHNPHGTFAAATKMGLRPHMVDRASGGEEPCMKCHSDKRGPFVFEHAAIRIDGCGSCHVPHGSTNAKLLTRPVEFTMCLECHNGQGTFGRENLGVFQLNTTHNMLDPRYQHCTSCHARIHGSNSDQLFLR
jgi:DmsE family decaheme c-type cytochrome